ncbi:hypothetical protein H2201_000136 [Coniosporium apollinis]|uniref:AN1-type domain-containing protein n=1 Tax=Coniosporium apollinis TaxID=61459 RepID=A0ABQ9P595_9PEZI|nr:hypothetical protein H2201_000136 [Coniosporium apollinis]
MSVGDVEAIGAHCQAAFCHQLDFLPFRCESCQGTFCLDHRTESAHACANAGAWARARRQQELGGTTNAQRAGSGQKSMLNQERECADSGCKTMIYTARTPGVLCATCNRSYCLKHRMREDHDCKNLKPVGARTTSIQTQQNREGALAKLKAWGVAKKAAASSNIASIKPKPAPTSAAARTTALSALKKNAKGDEKVPVEKRVYLHAEASADTAAAKFPRGEFFYNKEWSVGRVLDDAAKRLQVENLNNRSEGEENKLRVFHVEGGRLLDFSEKLGTAVQSGNTIVLLRGVGPPAPDLIQA